MELYILVVRERKDLILARQIFGAAAQRGHGFHTQPLTTVGWGAFTNRNGPERTRMDRNGPP